MLIIEVKIVNTTKSHIFAQKLKINNQNFIFFFFYSVHADIKNYPSKSSVKTLSRKKKSSSTLTIFDILLVYVRVCAVKVVKIARSASKWQKIVLQEVVTLVKGRKH